MNRLISSLAEVCEDRLLSEKWLLAPSYRTGYQWVESVARSGRPAVNLRVQTLLRIALDFAADRIRRDQVRLISGLDSALLVSEIWKSAGFEGQGYLSSLAPSWRLFESLAATLRSLRMAGVVAEGIQPQTFEVPIKGKEIRSLLAAWEKSLPARGLVDSADLLRWAVAELKVRPSLLPQETWILVPKDQDLLELERVFLSALPPDRLVWLEIDPPWSSSKPPLAGQATRKTTVQGSLFEASPSPASPASASLEISAFRAVGEVNEVREVFRRCLAGGISLDRVEVLHSDSVTYVPLFYESALALETEEGGQTEESGQAEDLPVTFEEGIPVRYSRPGKALALWLRWMAEGHPQRLLEEMLREGVLAVDTGDRTVPGRELAKVFSSVPIGLGLSRYQSALKTALRNAETRLAKAAREDLMEEEEPCSSSVLRDREERVRHLKDLGRFWERLRPLSAPTPGEKPADILDRIQTFLKTCARTEDRRDNYALEALEKSLGQVREALAEGASGVDLDLFEWLPGLVDTVRILGSRPRPGCLHVAPIATGGHSGRETTFLIGLDDNRFPGSGQQDPVLLDTERGKIANTLPTAADRLGKKIESFWLLMGRLRGHLTMSYSCRNLVDDREVFPSPLLLQTYRRLTGQAAHSLDGFLPWLPQPVAFVPETPESCLGQADLWLHNGIGRPGRDGLESWQDRFPHLARGLDSRAQRESLEWNAFEGVLSRDFWESLRSTLDPCSPSGPVLSASRIEKLAQCPRAYFFQYLLRIAPPDRAELDPAAWLSPLERGSLLHTVFQEFVRSRIEKDQIPVFARDQSEILQILQAEIEKVSREMPPPSKEVSHREGQELQDAVRLFLSEEEEWCQTSQPVLLEYGFGFGQESVDAEGQGRPEPIVLPLTCGKSIRIRGRVDRIDRVGENRFTLWDYKTGSSGRYTSDARMKQGRVLQPLLYLLAAERFLQEEFSPQAQAEGFGFFFPTLRGEGVRKVFERNQVWEQREVLSLLATVAAEGVFPATNACSDCAYCDFQSVCGDTGALADRIEEKLEFAAMNVGAEGLEAFRLLRTATKDPKK